MEKPDHLWEIFDAQEKLLRSLAPIYEHNEFHIKNTFPLNIDARHAQEEFRLLAWRISEEVYEALEEFDKGNNDAYREEVADVLHFFAELAIICGVSSTEVATGGDANLLLPNGGDYLATSFDRVNMYPVRITAQQSWGLFLTALAHLMMEFKQRPWRTDFRPSDKGRIKHFLGVAWFSFCTACIATGIDARMLHFHYFLKQQTNQKRKNDALKGIADTEGCSQSR